VSASTPRAVDRDRLLLGDPMSKAGLRERHQSVSLTTDTRLVALAALLATLVARALAPALPGSNVGIGRLILGVDQLAAFLSQFVVIVGAATSVRLLMRSMIERRLSYFQRLVSVVLSAAAIPIVLSAANRQIEPVWLATLVCLSAAVALVSVVSALRRPQARAAALVLGVATLASLVWASARIMALEASNIAYASLFEVAQGIASVGLLLDAASTAFAAFWLARQRREGRWLVLAAALLAALAVWAAASGDGAGGSDAWRVVMARSFAALAPHPDPFVSMALRYFIEAWAVLLAGVALWSQRGTQLGATLAFALLARASGDVPICALLLLLAALSTAFLSLSPADSDREALRTAGKAG
jgi:hypothetical protein